MKWESRREKEFEGNTPYKFHLSKLKTFLGTKRFRLVLNDKISVMYQFMIEMWMV